MLRHCPLNIRLDPRRTNLPPDLAEAALLGARRSRGLVVVPSDFPSEEFVTLTLTQEGELERREAAKGNNPIDWHGAYFDTGSRWFRAHAGDLIISRIDVRKGCIAIISDEYDNAIVTQEFPLYEVDTEKLRPYYLKLLLRTDYFRRAMRAITTGHPNRRRTQDSDFEGLEIFLPDPEVQDQICQLVQDREDAIRAEQLKFHSMIGEVERAVIGSVDPVTLLKEYGEIASAAADDTLRLAHESIPIPESEM